MALFSKKNDQVRCGVLLDINSGSVGVAIVISDKVTGKLETGHTEKTHLSKQFLMNANYYGVCTRAPLMHSLSLVAPD
jgi:hypothetical protein